MRLKSLGERILESGARRLPGRFAAFVDRLRPGLQTGFGGPFNGQQRRIEAVRDIFAAVPFRAIIETGTYRATTALFLRELSNAPIATIEAVPRYYHYAAHRLRGTANTRVILGDSAAHLNLLATEAPWNSTPAFFYLDAHWLALLPLVDELRAILHGWRDFAVLIDDFRVPDDPGYAYDDYGPGAVLDLDILQPFDERVVAYWPAEHSSVETGARRGWVLLASPGGIDIALAQVTSVRRMRVQGSAK